MTRAFVSRFYDVPRRPYTTCFYGQPWRDHGYVVTTIMNMIDRFSSRSARHFPFHVRVEWLPPRSSLTCESSPLIRRYFNADGSFVTRSSRWESRRLGRLRRKRDVTSERRRSRTIYRGTHTTAADNGQFNARARTFVDANGLITPWRLLLVALTCVHTCTAVWVIAISPGDDTRTVNRERHEIR